MDENKLIIHLLQNVDTKFLEEKTQLIVKDKDMPNLETTPFSNVIIESTYLICGSKIFYLQSQKALENGILDMEDLSLPINTGLEDEVNEHKEERDSAAKSDSEESPEHDLEVPTVTQNFVVGPIQMRGSNQFLLALLTGQTVKM